MVAGILMLVLASAGQDDRPKPAVSKAPLTAEQIEIYRVVLEKYVAKDSNAALNIANRTEPLDTTRIWEESVKCIRRLKLERPPQSPIVHRLSPEVALGPRMVLVDPNQQSDLVKENDPSNLVRRAIDDREPVTDQTDR